MPVKSYNSNFNLRLHWINCIYYTCKELNLGYIKQFPIIKTNFKKIKLFQYIWWPDLFLCKYRTQLKETIYIYSFQKIITRKTIIKTIKVLVQNHTCLISTKKETLTKLILLLLNKKTATVIELALQIDEKYSCNNDSDGS